MNQMTYREDWPDINTGLYNRSVKLFSAVKHILSVKLELYADTQVLQGDIFLFNHFSRFETFIPQFLIFEKTGAYSCAVASGEFFKEDNALSRYLSQVGVFPHDHPRLFAMLAGQILRGRKVIIFPEGGMVKDHRMIDKHGEYSIYSRITGGRHKQHTGPAVLGQGVEALKAANLEYRTISTYQLAAWHFEDELLGLAFEQETYRSRGKGDINRQETATADPAPFFIRPDQPNGLGVLLIHGLLASPAELKDYGHYLAKQGFTVLGIRLKGHGTSPYALRDVSYEQWFASVRRGFNILRVYCPKLFVIGFSTGGALALQLAAENHAEILGLVVVPVPIHKVRTVLWKVVKP